MNKYISLFAIFIMLLSFEIQALNPHDFIHVGDNITFKKSLGEETIKLSLDDVIYLGLRNNRNIRSAHLNRIAQKFDLKVMEDSFTPKAIISNNITSIKNNNDSSLRENLSPEAKILTPYGTRISLGWAYQHINANHDGVSYSDGVDLNIIQPLLRGAGKNITTAPITLSKLSEEINKLNLKDIVSQTITQIIKSYRDLILAQEQLKISQDSLNRARQLLEVNKSLISAGRMAEFEIVQTEAEVASQELIHEETLDRLDSARLALLQLLSLDLNTSIIATEPLKTTHIDINKGQALQQAEMFQPIWLTQLLREKQAEINLSIAKDNRLWDVSLVGGVSQLRNKPSGGSKSNSMEKYLGVQIEIPIGDLTEKQQEIRSEIDSKNEKIRSNELKQELERNVINSIRNIETLWRQYEISQRSLNLSKRKLDIEKEKLGVGRSSNFQVLSFENDLRNAENLRVNALINYLNAQADLDQVLGTTLQSWDIKLND